MVHKRKTTKNRKEKSAV